jgi:hypothetical protein
MKHDPILPGDRELAIPPVSTRAQRVGWVERSDTHQLHLMEVMGFEGSTHPTYLRQPSARTM